MPAYSEVTKLAGILSALREPWDHHGDDVAKYAVILADALHLPKEQVELIRVGANLHDIGKLVMREELLNLPRKLEPEEMAQMQQHTVLGWAIVEQAGYDVIVQQIVRSHHERWNGKGYPDGLKGDEIPIGAQIVSIADSYSAWTCKRPYRDALSHHFTQAYIQKDKGTRFKPDLVDLFFSKVTFRFSEGR
jgi:putative nucleotidyltransferase with HDIG domain